MLKFARNIKKSSLFFLYVLIILTSQSGCIKKETEVEYLRIAIDWSSIKKDHRHPITACSFYIFSGVKLTLGPTEEVINGETYEGMEGYENDNIENRGNCIYRFLIKRVEDGKFSVILDSTVKTKVLLKKFPGTIHTLDNNIVNDSTLQFDPGKHEFEINSREQNQ